MIVIDCNDYKLFKINHCNLNLETCMNLHQVSELNNADHKLLWIMIQQLMAVRIWENGIVSVDSGIFFVHFLCRLVLYLSWYFVIISWKFLT